MPLKKENLKKQPRRHISFSEMKVWTECPFKHKLVYLDKIKGFQGNEYTAFGTAIHTVCERLLLDENIQKEEVFTKEFEQELISLPNDYEINEKMICDMEVQGKEILPHVLPGMEQYFGEYKVINTEEDLYEIVDLLKDTKYNFKGFIDLVIQTQDGKYHIIDWKTCSWGWNREKRTDKLITYQLTLYKHFYAKKYNIDPQNIETHFALLKRTSKKERVELFRVTSGPTKTQNALNLLKKALVNINKNRYIKNRLSCARCEFYNTQHCPK